MKPIDEVKKGMKPDVPVVPYQPRRRAHRHSMEAVRKQMHPGDASDLPKIEEMRREPRKKD